MSSLELAPFSRGDDSVQPPRSSVFDVSVASSCTILLTCLAVGYWLSCLDAAVVALSVAVIQGAVRRLLALAAILMLPAAFPPWELPCYAFCLAPLVWMWQERDIQEGERPFSERKATVAGVATRSRLRAAIEGLAMGFAAAWLASGFLRDALWSRGWMIQAIACLAFGLQLGVVMVAIRETRRMGIGRAALVTATVATIVEWIQARWGVAWPVMGLSVAVTETPLAHWAASMGPFGLAWVLYLVNFLMVWGPGKTDRNVRHTDAGIASRWRGPLCSALLLSGLWVGGVWIEKTTPVGALPLSALMIQPRVLLTEKSQVESLQVIDRLTVASLKDHGPVDLVIWPEGCVLPSPHPAQMSPNAEHIPPDRWDLIGSHDKFMTRYQSAGLFGTSLHRTRQVQRYGLPIDESQLYNAAVLLDRAGAIKVHEKLSLVPLKEGLPGLLDAAWVRRSVLPALGLEAPLTAGERYQNLEFTTHEGKSIRIAVCICYESLHPGLPQFDPTHRVDAIVHLLYDGHFVSHPEWIERHLMACRARAIETRTWSLVCSSCAGSAIIDPRGTIMGRCPDAECVLRSDTIPSLLQSRSNP